MKPGLSQAPFIPETAPFNAEQRAWLNGFLAGLFARTGAPGSSPAPPAESANSAEPLLILFGSQTGSAEGLARRTAKEAQQRGFAPRVLPLNDFEQEAFTKAGKALIISSTWGDGEPPDNAANFWSWLNAQSAPRLETLQFAVLGLGDRNYADFCGASKKFDARLEALGAQRLLARGECDVDYESAAKAWLESFWESTISKPSTPPSQFDTARLADLTASPGSAGASAASAASNGAVAAPNGHSNETNGYSRSNPFPARVLKNVLLNGEGSEKEVRHYELSLAGSGLRYAVGDALGIVPTNCPELVRRWLSFLGCNDTEPVKAGERQMPLGEALLRYFDLGKPSPELISAVAKAAPGGELAALSQPGKQSELKQWLWGRDILDLLQLLPDPMPLGQVLAWLRKLTPRLYSISSSPKAHPEEVHITVSTVRYSCHGRARKGVASTFLADRIGDQEFAKIFVQPSHGFKPPTNAEAPMIMVGPGTGIAPFRAFLEERHASGAKGKNWLFFGDQKRATDFLYEQQLGAWQSSGLLTRLELAFSRDQEKKVYVQDRMMENAAELWKWLEEGAHFYVCGDASRMAKDVDATLHRIIEQQGRKSADDAGAYVAKLKSEKRYQRDVY